MSKLKKTHLHLSFFMSIVNFFTCLKYIFISFNLLLVQNILLFLFLQWSSAQALGREEVESEFKFNFFLIYLFKMYLKYICISFLWSSAQAGRRWSASFTVSFDIFIPHTFFQPAHSLTLINFIFLYLYLFLHLYLFLYLYLTFLFPTLSFNQHTVSHLETFSFYLYLYLYLFLHLLHGGQSCN